MAIYPPEFLEALRQRYEETDQPLRTLLAEFKISETALYKTIQREGWTLRTHRARKMRPESRLIEDVIALVDAPGTAERAFKLSTNTECSPPHPDRANARPGAGSCGEGSGVGVSVERQCHRITSTPLPNPPPQGGREQAGSVARADSREAALERLEDFLLRRLEAEQAACERAAETGDSAAGERGARTVSIIIRALTALRELRGEPAQLENNAYVFDDDMPADIDEFRRELARSIDAFVESETRSADDRAREEPALVAKT